MSLTSQDWHARFTRQARWTSDLRRHLFARLADRNFRCLLEVGCGTGAVLNELASTLPGTHGLDIDRSHLELAVRHVPDALLVQGDAHHLPYASASFDITICHFLLLWVSDPQVVVHEMARLTRSGGCVLALAEPDYGGRIDFPDELAQLGQWQQSALRLQGADPQVGRRLAAIFHAAGLRDVETGVLGGQWRGAPSPDEIESEWAILRADLQGVVPDQELLEWRQRDLDAWRSGERVLFVPTFYALGIKA